MYALIIDFFLVLFKNETYRESTKTSPHCNLLSKERLSEILNRAGFEIKNIEVSQLYNLREKVQNRFKKQPISYRNLYGVAVLKNK